MLPKRQLTRIVLTPDDQVLVDPSGKLSGRGAYLCPQKSCWMAALRHRGVGQALKRALVAKERADLEAYAMELPDGVEES